MTYGHMAADVTSLMADLGCKRYSVLGHSLGGKIASYIALEDQKDKHDATILSAIVVDMAPIDHGALGNSMSKIFEAMRDLDMSQVTSLTSANQALREKIAEPAVRAFVLTNLLQDQAGHWKWRCNLPALIEARSPLFSFPAELQHRHFSGPSLFIRGEHSEYVPLSAYPDILRHFPTADIQTVSNAGHWVHADKPQEFTELVSNFLRSQHAS